MKTKKLILILGGILILLVILVSGNRQSTTPPAQLENSPTIHPLVSPAEKFTLIIDFGNSAEKISQSLNFQKGENLLDAMIQTNLKIETKTYVGLGSIIESINDFKSGTNGKYWQYWVNGKYSQVGASAYQIQPGDVIEWRFSSENSN